ncbi:sulfate transporter [Planococcus antarcticus DSM 14505]|uniref:Sodium-independent anion transporter n=1 Tax=Planococcus antarcticus DSM 14505 TaxID=1185653 RepID=A0A1C7DEH0_9BACL|nr:SulP family inorganic anion transporter [Planococcus antarcticus]ANU09671.1 sodium-independent anion transporter [Planococcus antarcticus DSM 14505]EIM05509.1 sulfate transporter [Planococcus antarcticus DSM 14505]
MEKKSIFTGRYAGYSFQSFKKDLLSGIVVGVIAIPLGMAFAIASGVNPEYGIYTTIIAGILISIFGGSKFQIGGPTGAFIPVLFAIVIAYGYESLLLAGFMAGIILLLMGIFKLGSLIKYIPRPVTIGFTSGIAVIIFVGQVSNFLGLTGVEKHESFLPNVKEIILHIQTVNLYSVLTAVICLATVILTPKIIPKVPGPLIGLLVSTVVASVFFPSEVATIGSTFGKISNKLPEFHFPEITFERLQLLIGPAFVIAMLGGIESLLSAVVADGMTGSKHNSNRELIGQGIANMVTPLFGGIPATGAIARTATNIKNGAVSPFSGIIHGVVVLLVLILFAPYASTIPLASMAPVLMIVAWNMSERHVFVSLLKTKTADSLVLLATFLLTVFVSLTVAVEVGLLFAVVLFTKQMSELLITAKVLPDPDHKDEKVGTHMVTDIHDCPQISIYNVEGPLFFGSAQAFEQSIMNTIHYKPNVLMLRMGKVPFMDTTGESYLSSIIKDFSKQGTVLISGMKPHPISVMKKTGLYDYTGEEHFFEHTGEAIDFSLEKLDKNKCLGCQHFAFKECTALSAGIEFHKAKIDKHEEVLKQL